MTIASDSYGCKRKVSEREFDAQTNRCDEIKNIYSNAYLTYYLKNVYISRADLTHMVALPNVIYHFKILFPDPQTQQDIFIDNCQN